MKNHIELINKINTIGLDPTAPTSLGGNEMELRQFIFQLKKAIVGLYSEIEILNQRIDKLQFESAMQNDLVEPD